MRGRKPGELTALQARQREKTRHKIIEAANYVFARNSYIGASIDDIAQRAGISRATFYKHFSTKLDVASAILKRYTTVLVDDYAKLALDPNPGIEKITEWISGIVDIWRKLRPGMTSLSSLLRQDPELITGRYENYNVLISRLGEGIRAFAIANSGVNEEAKVRAHLLLIELEEMCYAVVISGWSADEDAAIRVVAKHFLDFIEEYAPASLMQRNSGKPAKRPSRSASVR